MDCQYWPCAVLPGIVLPVLALLILPGIGLPFSALCNTPTYWTASIGLLQYSLVWDCQYWPCAILPGIGLPILQYSLVLDLQYWPHAILHNTGLPVLASCNTPRYWTASVGLMQYSQILDYQYWPRAILLGIGLPVLVSCNTRRYYTAGIGLVQYSQVLDWRCFELMLHYGDIYIHRFIYKILAYFATFLMQVWQASFQNSIKSAFFIPIFWYVLIFYLSFVNHLEQ